MGTIASRQLLVALLVAWMGGGCSSIASVSTDEPNLAGSYEISSITVQDDAPITPPQGTGTPELTQTRYTLQLSFDVPGEDIADVNEAGTYSISGNEWTQVSDETREQRQGTYSYDGDTLTIPLETQSGETEYVWRKVG